MLKSSWIYAHFMQHNFITEPVIQGLDRQKKNSDSYKVGQSKIFVLFHLVQSAAINIISILQPLPWHIVLNYTFVYPLYTHCFGIFFGWSHLLLTPFYKICLIYIYQKVANFVNIDCYYRITQWTVMVLKSAFSSGNLCKSMLQTYINFSLF